MQLEHAWNLVSETSWNGVSKVISFALANGTNAPYKAGNTIYTAIYNGQTVQVVTRLVHGAVTIVDAWVKTR